MLEVSWRHDGRRLLVPILILGPDPNNLRSEQVVALLDTGATTSAVTAAVAERLDLPFIGKRMIASAHGDQPASRYLFRVGVVASGAMENPMPYLFEPIDGFEIRAGFEFEALLGMDILRQCDFSLSRNGACSLRLG